ncbi:uncharacterized protein LOC110841646 [Folsomia candida]|nr:uncharacterized protein LOC110841646 [Folsomia candida]
MTRCICLLLVIANVALGLSVEQKPVPAEVRQTQTNPAQPPLAESVWRQQLTNAVQGATDRFQTNFVTVLNGLANTTQEAGTNVTIALATLTRAVVTNTFDLASVVAYMPRLLLLDLPNQFVEVLKLIRRNEVRVIPADVNGAIDSILFMTRQAEESGITRKIFDPIARFLPNMMAGLSEFFQTIIGTTANVFGVGVTRYDPQVSAGIVTKYNLAY